MSYVLKVYIITLLYALCAHSVSGGEERERERRLLFWVERPSFFLSLTQLSSLTYTEKKGL